MRTIMVHYGQTLFLIKNSCDRILIYKKSRNFICAMDISGSLYSYQSFCQLIKKFYRNWFIFLFGYLYVSGSPAVAGIWLSAGRIRCHGHR